MCQGREHVPNDRVVLRLSAPRDADAFHSSKEVTPLPGDFRLTDRECREAENNGGIGGLSVWDSLRTTPNQARSFLPSQRRRIVFQLSVGALSEIPDHNLHVCRDPLSEDKAGADGHCLIANAYSRDEIVLRSIRASIVRVAKHFPEDEE